MFNKENMLIKFKNKSSDKFGVNPMERSFEELLDKGFIVVDKDSGPTSHQTTDYLKKILKIDKAGHSGTLDPKVTGVLVCGLGRATRLMEYMLKSNKEYILLAYFHKPVSDEQLNSAIKKFTGTFMQTPPIVSAVKRQPRERTIYELELLDVSENRQDVLMRVRCQHGTYMRKLATDMGDFIGINCHMKELRRTKAGAFTEWDNSIGLDKLRNLMELYEEDKSYESEVRKYIQPMEGLLRDFKKVIVRDSAVDYICHGSDLAVPGVLMLDDNIELGEEVALLTGRGELIGMGMAFMKSKDVIKRRKGAFVKVNKTFLEPDTYPKEWRFGEEE